MALVRRSRPVVLPVIVLTAAIFVGTTAASAQFSLDTAERNTTPVSPITAVDKTPIKIDVVNAAQKRADRKVKWRLHNTVDTKVSLTGTVNYFNDAWAANNQRSYSLEVSGYYYHTYTTGRHISIFKFDAIYGMNRTDWPNQVTIWFKSQDMFKLYYLASWKIKLDGFWKDWSYGLSTEIASQFTQGFKGIAPADREVVWSNFFAPGTVNLGAGLTYTSPNPKLPFIVTVNPVSVNTLFVLDDRIDDARRKSLGISENPLRADKRPLTTYGGEPMNYKLEGGSNLNVAFNRTFTFGKRKGITLQYNTTLTSFYGWMTQASRRDLEQQALPEILPTVQWNNTLSFSPVHFLLIEFRHVMRYDRSQIAPNHTKAGLQMQYYLRIGLTYRYLNKK